MISFKLPGMLIKSIGFKVPELFLKFSNNFLFYSRKREKFDEKEEQKLEQKQDHEQELERNV